MRIVWRLAIVAAIASSTLACTPLGELPSDQVATTTSIPTTSIPAATTTTTTSGGDQTGGTTTPTTRTTASSSEADDQRWSQRCTNEAEGWVVAYPADWHVYEGAAVGPCRLFDPYPIELPSEASEVPPSIAVQLRTEDAVRLQGVTEDPTIEVVDRRAVLVDGRPAERLEERHRGSGLLTEGTRSVRYVVDLGGRVLLASAFDLGQPEFTAKVRVLDELVQRVDLVEPDPDAVRAALPEDTVAVFFTPAGAEADCGAIRPVPRSARWPMVLRSAVEALLRGPTAAEREAGLTSWFSEDTAGMLSSVNVVGGVAHVDLVDFSAVIPNASTSCGSAMLLRQLDATVTQFPEIDRAVYSFGGDVEAFYRWLQLSPPDAG